MYYPPRLPMLSLSLIINTFLLLLEDITPPLQFTFDIAGFRHNEGMSIKPIHSLQGASVALEHDKANAFDGVAVGIYYNGKKLGYAPKGINKAILDLQNRYKLTATMSVSTARWIDPTYSFLWQSQNNLGVYLGVCYKHTPNNA